MSDCDSDGGDGDGGETCYWDQRAVKGYDEEERGERREEKERGERREERGERREERRGREEMRERGEMGNLKVFGKGVRERCSEI